MTGTRVAALWRYPVKSMAGETVPSAEVTDRGLVGDRLWAVRDADGKLGSGKSTRRFRRMEGLLECRARADHDGPPLVTLPGGRMLPVDDPATAEALSSMVGRPVTLAPEAGVSHFDDAPVHLVSRMALARLSDLLPDAVVDERRFRPNVLLDGPGSGFVEDAWVGRRLRVGDVVLHVVGRTERCVMTTMAQQDLPDEPRVLRTVAKANDLCFGVYATVLEPGSLQVGDLVVPL